MSESSHISSIFNVSRNDNFYIYVPLSYNLPAFMLRGVFFFLSEFLLFGSQRGIGISGIAIWIAHHSEKYEELNEISILQHAYSDMIPYSLTD